MTGAAIGLIAGASGEADPPNPAASELITITMENCQAKRPGTLRNDTSALKMIFSGIAKEELVKRGVVEIDGRKYTFYLPKANAYPIRNDHKSDSSLDNSSTLISLDRYYLDDRRYPPAESSGVLIINAPNERELTGLLTRVDRALFQVPESGSAPLPLEGRKLQVFSDWGRD